MSFRTGVRFPSGPVLVIRMALQSEEISYHMPAGDDWRKDRFAAGIFVAKGEEDYEFKRILRRH